MSTTPFSQNMNPKDPRPLIPALGRYYGFTSDFAYLIVRVTAGLMLLPHGWPKVLNPGGALGYFTKLGLEPSWLFTSVAMFNENLGGILIAIGLFTRPIAALLIIEFLVLMFKVHVARGYGVAVNGIELPLMWLMLFIAILLRGGGPWSVDRRLGREI